MVHYRGSFRNTIFSFAENKKELSRNVLPISGKRFAFLFGFFLFILMQASAVAQLSGIKTIDPGGSGPDNYATFTAAITALNTGGVGTGGVTFNVAAGIVFNENPPAITATGTVVNPIVFQKSGVGLNPKIIPVIAGTITSSTTLGSNGDAIIRINGGDFITFDGIDLAENPTFTGSGKTEYGYHLAKASATDACKNIIIRNCTITLDKTTIYSFGIFVSNFVGTSSVTVTSTGGRSESIKIYNNNISNVYGGIQLRGYAASSPYDFYDQNIEIGVDGANSITNFGGGSSTAYAIYVIYQNNVRINNNNIDGGTGTTTTLYGIFTSTGTSSNVDIIGNTVSIYCAATTSTIYAIANEMGATAASNTINMNNNIVQNCTYTTSTSGVFYGIRNNASAATVNIDGNTVTGNTLPGTGTFYGIDGGTCTTLNMNNNIINNNEKTGASGTLYCFRASTAITTCSSNIIHDNSMLYTSGTSTSSIYGYYNLGSPTIENFYNNNIFNLIISGTSTATGSLVNGFYCNTTAGATKNIYGNTVRSLQSHIGSVVGIRHTLGTTINIYKNRIYDLTCTTGTVDGLSLTTGTTANVYNNYISDLKAPNSSDTNAVNGIKYLSSTLGNTLNAYYNTIYLNASSTGASFGSSAIHVTSSNPTVDLRNNILVNVSTPNGIAYTVAYRRGSSDFSNYAPTSNNNCFYAGIPGTNNLIHYSWTHSDQTIGAYKARVAPRDGASFSENPPFVNVMFTPYNLHLQTTAATQCESGGTSISAITDDFDGDLRYGATGYTGTGTAPDVGADEGNFISIDLNPPSIAYSLPGNGPAASSRLLSNVVITDPSGVNGSPGTRPRIYYKKSTDANTFAGNTSTDNGWKWMEASGSTSPFTFTIDYSLLQAPASIGDIIQYFVVAQDLSPAVNIGINSGTFAITPASVNLTAAAFPITGTINSYNIAQSRSGAYDIGATAPTYTTLKHFFDDVNASVVTGNITANIIDNTTETASASLDQMAVDPPNSPFTITIQPLGGGARTISGSITGGVIKLNGADRIIIDGLNTGGNSLTISNTSTATNTAAIWISSLGTGQGAVNNTIRNCTILAGDNSVTSTFGIYTGGTSISTTGTGNDNDNLTIQNNTIKKTYFAIYVRASSSGVNDNLIITGNTIGSSTPSEYVTFRGVDVAGAVSPLISQNEIFNLQVSTSVNNAGIDLGADVTNALVIRNKIYGLRSTTTSGYGTYGINISSGTGTSGITIANNMIYDLITDGDGASTTYNPFGIRITGGTNHKIYFNSVNLFGSFLNLTTSDISAALCITSNTVTGLDIRNNIFANSLEGGAGTKSYSIYAVDGTIFGTINHNDYYVSGPNAMLGFHGSDKASLIGWQASTGQDLNSLSLNPSFTSNTNLHVSSGTTPHPLESGAAAIPGFAIDFDGDVRPGPIPSFNGGAIAPDIGADEFDGVPTDIIPPTIAYLPLGNHSSTTTRVSTGFASITDISGVNTTSGTRPRIYYKKSTDVNDYVGNTSTDNGWKWVEASNTTSPFDFTIEYSRIYGGTVTIGDVIQYFVVAQDLATVPNIAINSGTFSVNPTSVALTSFAFPITGAINNYMIAAALAGIYNVGAGQTYNTLTGSGGLFEAINNGVLTADITAIIISDLTEDGAHALNKWAEQGAGNYSITIKPDGTTERVISGAVANGMIRLNGTKRLIIDGRFAGSGKYLRFRNTNTSNPTITLFNNATYNLITHSYLEGATTSTTNGVIHLSTATVTGNSNNRISNCEIRDATSVPANLFYSSSNLNTADTLSENSFFNYTANAVRITTTGAGDNWVIASNAFFQTAFRSSQLLGIYAEAGNGHKIINNNFGGSAPDRSGLPFLTSSTSSPAVTGIRLAVGTTATTQVTGNTFGNIECSGSGFYGVYTTSGNVNISNNRIGHILPSSDTIKAAGTSYIVYNTGFGNVLIDADTIGYITNTGATYPIYASAGNNTITNNRIEHISAGGTFYVIYTTSGSVNNIITNNTLTDLTTTTSSLYGIWTASPLTNIVSNNVLTGLTNMSTLYGLYASGTAASVTMSNNTVSGLVNNTTGTSTTTGIYITSTGTNAITGNNVNTLVQNTPVSGGLFGIYITPAGATNTISNNTINSLTNNGWQGPLRGIYSSSSGASTIHQNTISNLTTVNNGVAYGMQITDGTNTITENTVHSIGSGYDTLSNTFGLLGISLSAATANNTVAQNTIYNLSNTKTSVLSTVSAGIFNTGSLSGTTIRRNRIYNISAAGTGTGTAAPSIHGIYASGASNVTFSNNMISLGDGIGNEVLVSGITDWTTGAGTNWYYNSVYLAGTLASGANNSAAFTRFGSANMNIRNNLFHNNRSGGSGYHYALTNLGATPATGWGSTASNYNLFVTNDTLRIAEWGTGVGLSLSNWQALNGGDLSSWREIVSNLSPTSLFTTPTVGNLSILTTSSSAWYVNGKGIPIAGISNDFDATNVRSTSVSTGATDIGADEFTPSSLPPAAIASAAPALGITTTYSFAGRILGSIAWGTSGTVPSSIAFEYYSGANPPGTLQGNYSNAFWNITGVGGVGFTYDLTLNYDPAIMGTISQQTDIRIAKRDAGPWTHYAGSTLDVPNKTITVTALTSLSDFTLSDNTSPLPVELVAFAAKFEGSVINLNWKTISELNMSRFAIERRTEFGYWCEIGFVDAQGSADAPMTYQFLDNDLPAASVLFYRLRLIDRDGTFSYSDEVGVELAYPCEFTLFTNYPNPFNSGTTISFSLPHEEFVSVRIYDMNGREVDVLASDNMSAGFHSIRFFVKNLPSGAYRCVVSAGDQVRTGVMILAR